MSYATLIRDSVLDCASLLALFLTLDIHLKLEHYQGFRMVPED
jgi:hypothetical protein